MSIQTKLIENIRSHREWIKDNPCYIDGVLEKERDITVWINLLGYDPIQNNCKYGYVLPDRCRYMRHLGCACGAYPPQS